MWFGVLILLAVTYCAVSCGRLVLAWRHLNDTTRSTASPSVTVLQPILSGDPALAQTLALGPEHAPNAHFVWLIDDDDTEAHAVAYGLAQGHQNIQIISGRPPRDGENPKTLKLIRGEASAQGTEALAVLDDDTTLPQGGLNRLAQAACAWGGLATALPTWGRAPRGPSEALVAGFVDGQGASAYLAMARLGRNRTINGMAYAMEARALVEVGGVASIGHDVTDDWAVAQAFTRAGRPLVQTTVPAHVAVSVPDLAAALRVLRRWTVFAHRYVAANVDGAMVLMILLPAVIPLAGLIVAILLGPFAVLLWLVLLTGRAALHRKLVQAVGGAGAAPLWATVVSELALPILSLLASVRPNRIRWRSRTMHLTPDGIRYE